MTLCKANMEFTLENWGLGDDPASFWETAYEQNVSR